MTAREQFIVIIPRHLRVLKELTTQKPKDLYGAIGWGALRDEDDAFSYGQLFGPLMERGLIEDLTATEMGSAGKHFVRITPLGSVCMNLGLMLRDPRKLTVEELKTLAPPERKVSERPDISGDTGVVTSVTRE
jgi:hypothetical protein